MQVKQEKVIDKPQNTFSCKDRYTKRSIIPNFMTINNFEENTKPFGMYQLQRSWLNSIKFFRQLVSQIVEFNKQLTNSLNKTEIRNYLKTYHLYRNLYEQLNNVNSLVQNVHQAQKKIDQIKKWFMKQKIKIRQIKNIYRALPGIKVNLDSTHQEQQNLRKTISDIRSKRQYEIHSFMPKTSYNQHFPYKDRTFEYKNEQQQSMSLSQTVSVYSQSTPYQSHLFNNQLSLKSIHSKSNSLSNLASTTFASRIQNQPKFSKKTKFQTSKQQKWRSRSDIFSLKNKKDSNWSAFKYSTTLNLIPKIERKTNRNSFIQMDKMIKKDKIDKMINQSDSKLQKQLLIKKQQIPNQTNNINSSPISFIIKPSRTQFINRKHFISIDSEMNKIKINQTRFKTDLNRKLEFRKYMSNHIISSNVQILKDTKIISLKDHVGKKIMCLPKKQLNINLSQNQNSKLSQFISLNNQKIISEQNWIDSVDKKRKQFQDKLRTKQIQNTIKTYSKYFDNHLIRNPQENQQPNNSQFEKTHSTVFSKNTLKFDSKNHSQKKFRSLTSFKQNSLQRRIQPSKQLLIMKTIKNNSIQKQNYEMAEQVVKIKLKISQNNNQNSLKSIISNNIIFKGLKINQQTQQTSYQTFQPKLFSNPFFVVPKSKKKGKKKKN